jgi:hypothetical protein
MNSFRTVLQDSSGGKKKILLDSTCSVFLFNDILVFTLLSDSRERQEAEAKEETQTEAVESLYVIKKVLHLSILFGLDERDLVDDANCLMFGFPHGMLALFGNSDLLHKWSDVIWDHADKAARRDFDNAQGTTNFFV